jgi:hypothetical protein
MAWTVRSFRLNTGSMESLVAERWSLERVDFYLKIYK